MTAQDLLKKALTPAYPLEPVVPESFEVIREGLRRLLPDSKPDRLT
jgi:hypothetical protein